MKVEGSGGNEEQKLEVAKVLSRERSWDLLWGDARWPA